MATIHSLAEIENILLQEIPRMLSLPAGQVTIETPLQTLGLDSLLLLELVVFIEKKFGISLLDAPLTRQDLETIHALSQHIAKLLQG